MKRARIVKTRKQHPTSHSGMQSYQGSDRSDFDQPISREIVKKKPVTIGKSGFTSFIRKIKHTENGMESEVEKPMLMDGLGYRAGDNGIKGRCDVCRAYVSNIYNCYVHGCKKLLCQRDVYFFKRGDKEIPYCLAHYKQVVNEFDTWQAYEDRRRPKEKNEK